MSIRFVPNSRWVASAAAPLMISSLMVAGTSADSPAADPDSGQSELRTDEMVPMTPVDPGEARFIDPSADQTWSPAPARDLPEPATAVFALDGGSDKPAGFPVSVRYGAPVRTASLAAGLQGVSPGAGSVRVSVADRAATEAAGVEGLLVSLSGTRQGWVEVAVDYASLAERYGGGWASRLQLVELPSCALTTPDAPGCLEITPVSSRVDRAGQKVSARLELAGDSGLARGLERARASGPARTDAAGRVLALTGGSESEGSGDYRATDLAAAGSWTESGGTGAFTYGYPLRVPPAAGPVPSVSLGYSSASHDGRTSGRNGQASWIGDGWGYSPGFIERSYRPCSLDEGGNTPELTGDQCWDDDGASVTLALNGANNTLVRDDATGEWRAQADANWRVEKRGSPASNSGSTSERWKVTTPDGTRYFFSSEPGSSESRLTVPVFGNNSGEPCKRSAFEDSSCRQAYRWLLDKTVDVHGNMVRYFYDRTTGYYGAALDPENRVGYHRDARLKRIEYGLRAGDSGVPATGRVIFTAGKRCVSDCGSYADPNEKNWPDTPWDLHCDKAPCTSQLSPTFFSTHRLTKITTQVRDGSGYEDVDSWRLEHEFKDYGDDEQVVMWLKSIQHTGHVGGDDIAMPKTVFGGEALPNRVDAAPGVPVMWRWRLSSIKSETGAVTTVTYAEPECTPGNLPSNEHQNDMRCYPVRWTPEFHTEPVEDWFHKHVVESVVENDTTGGGVAVETYYDYSTAGGGTSTLWAFDESELTEDEHRTYNVWRGYPQVTTRLGDPAGTQTKSRSRFYRGLDGQPLPSGGTRSVRLTDAEGNKATDHEALAGQAWETLTYNGSQVIAGATYRYWKHKTATQERDHDGGDLEAWLTGMSVEKNRTRLSSSAWQRTETRTSFDDQGRVIEVSDLGDVDKSGDELCTRNEYADNNSKWIKEAVKRVEVVSVACGTSPSRPDDLVSDTKTYFDGSDTHGATPSKGMPTRVDTLDDWESGAEYVTTRQEYDALGRVVSSTDPLGHTSSTSFTPAGPGPLTRVVGTNPLGHQETIDLEPAWGVQVASIDPNGRRADLSYDSLGRLTAVWKPGRDEASESASMQFEYVVRDDAPSAVVSRRLNHAEEYVTGVELYDSLLRPRQTQTQTHDGGRLVTETIYDTHGRVEEEYGPNPNQDAPDTTLVRAREDESARRFGYIYDAAGRVTDEVFYNKHAERWRTTTSYGGSTAGFMVTVRPPEGAPATATVTDARGRTIEKRTYRSNDPTGDYDSLTYEHTPDGQLERMTDPAGNEWSWEYDLRGRQIATDHPDAGTVTTAFDAVGRPVSTTDARGRTIETAYDALGRKITRHDGDGALLAEWEYDAVPGGVGLPAEATRWHDGEAYVNRVLKVNDQGLITQAMVRLPASLGPLAGGHYFTKTYTPNGLVEGRGTLIRGMEFTAEQVSFDHIGNPIGLTYQEGDDSMKEIVTDATYTPYNEIQTRLFGHTDERHAYHGFVYEEDTRRLARATFDRGASRHSVADVRYSYDDAGNMLSIADVPEDLPANHELQCFRYDDRRRLVDAWAQGETSGCATVPSLGVLGGPAPYWNSYDHDVAGNRTAETLRTPGRPAVSHSYQYPAAGQPQPHTVRQVSGGSEPVSFEYDASGNTTSREIGEQAQTLTWNAEGRVATVDGSGPDPVEMVYDVAGNRLVRDDGDSVTVFLPRTELTWDRTADEVGITRYFSHAGQVVATNTGTDVADWTYLSVDHHGTTTTHAVNAFTGVEQVRRTDPYGNPRGQAPPAWPGQQGFVGGVQDPTGLTHIGARSYDPVTGGFISADPVIDAGDDQQINGYAYGHNNPATFTDPTGLADYAGGGSGGRSDTAQSTGGTGQGRYCIDTACTSHQNPGNGKPPHHPNTTGQSGLDPCLKYGGTYCNTYRPPNWKPDSVPDPGERPWVDPPPAQPTPPSPSPGPSPVPPGQETPSQDVDSPDRPSGPSPSPFPSPGKPCVDFPCGHGWVAEQYCSINPALRIEAGAGTGLAGMFFGGLPGKIYTVSTVLTIAYLELICVDIAKHPNGHINGVGF